MHTFHTPHTIHTLQKMPALQQQQFTPGKLITMLLSATLITFALFVGMQKLIANDNIVRIEPTNYPVIDLTMFFKEEAIIKRIRLIPKPIPQPKPKLAVKIIDSEPLAALDPSSLIPSFGNPIIKNKFIPAFNIQGGDARPIVRVEPKYPSVAAREGVEGWVKLSFSITTSGTVNNIRVIDANPKRTFNKAARRALAKWKYKPNIQAGKAQVQDGMMVMLDFKLAS